MKKSIIFLIMIMTILALGKVVQAKETTFYEAEYLDNMYMSKYQYATNTIYYQRARFFQNRDTYQMAYCIEPLNFFQDGSTYVETTTPRNLSTEQIERIQKIVYFGYRYKNHFDASWYAVAQLMIWREASPSEGEYYFTETLNGAKTNKYDYQIDEINQLIYDYDHEIPIENQTITLVKGTKQEIEIGDILQKYTTNNEEIELTENTIMIHDLEEGEYTITLTREKDVVHNSTITIYQSETSQNMIQRGDLEPKNVQFKINIISNHVTLEKRDEETDSIIPQGEGSLNGAVYEIFNQDNESIESIEIIDNIGEIKNIPFGTYYLKETIPGNGYQLNTDIIEFTLSEENPNFETVVTNKVIQKEVIIQKYYGEEDNKKPEANIQFEIINKNGEVIDTITTDEEGKASIILPYGTYTIKQINTTDGYQIIDPFQIEINNLKTEEITLQDYLIPVPNTASNPSIWELIIKMIVMMIC